MSKIDILEQMRFWKEWTKKILKKYYSNSWGCYFCENFNVIFDKKCYNCGASQETATWIVNNKGEIRKGFFYPLLHYK
jgi:hypothetical protein